MRVTEIPLHLKPMSAISTFVFVDGQNFYLRLINFARQMAESKTNGNLPARLLFNYFNLKAMLSQVFVGERKDVL